MDKHGGMASNNQDNMIRWLQKQRHLTSVAHCLLMRKHELSTPLLLLLPQPCSCLAPAQQQHVNATAAMCAWVTYCCLLLLQSVTYLWLHRKCFNCIVHHFTVVVVEVPEQLAPYRLITWSLYGSKQQQN